MIRGRLSHFAIGALIGAGLGALCGSLDLLFRWLLPEIAFHPSSALAIQVFYLVPFAILGALVGALAPADRMRRTVVGFGLGLSSLILVGGYANLLWLPGLLDPRSLSADLVFLVLAAAIFWLTLRFLPQRRWEWPALAMVAVALCVGIPLRQSTEVGASPTSKGSAGVDLVVVLFDALRADHLGCYGYARPTSPTIDSLAGSGILFERAYAASSWTKPSLATLFTGVMPGSHGNHSVAAQLPPGLPTLPELLSTGGYHTGVFAENSFVSPLFGYGRGVDRIASNEADVPAQTILGHLLHQLAVRHRAFGPLLHAARWSNALDPRQFGKRHGGVDVLASALNWAEEIPAAEPAFVWLHLMKPHAPYQVPEEFDGLFGAAGQGPLDPPHVEGIHPYASAEQLEPAELQALVDNYDERIRYGDALLEDFLKGWQSRRPGREPWLILLSDHGEEFGEAGLYDHGHSLQEGVTHVPLILVPPGGTSTPQRSAAKVRLLDLPPTLLQLAGIPQPSHFQGLSLLNLSGMIEVEDRSVLAELEHGPQLRSEALWREGFKLIRTRAAGEEALRLHQLATDAAEAVDLSRIEGGTLSWMLPELERAVSAAADARRDGGEVQLDAATEERLRALGYIR